MLVEDVKCKVYLEGIEIPFNSVSISERVGASAQATVSIPAVEEALYLLPKTLVHIFYKIKDKFYLIFEGALSSYGFSRSAGSRNVSLSFLSNFVEWDKCYLSTLNLEVGEWTNSHFFLVNTDTMWNGSDSKTAIKTKDIQKGDIGETTTDTVKNKFSWKSTDSLGFDSLLNNIKTNLASIGTGSSTFKNLIVNSPDSLLNYITKSNPYYAMLNESLKLNERLYIAENSKIKSLLSDNVKIDILSNKFSNLGSRSSIVRILQMIANYIKYDWVNVAAPTKNGNDLYNTFIKPTTDYFVPINCNVVFPSQIMNSSYSRNMESEPTRMLFNARPLGITGAPGMDKSDLSFHFAVPRLSLETKTTEDGRTIRILNMSDEEKYRGITGIKREVTNPLYKLSFKNKTDEDVEAAGSELSLATNNPEMVQVINTENSKYTREFFNLRYSTRQTQVVTTYSPYRLVGFPVIILDDIFPSVYGQLVSVTSEINASGGLKQVLSVSSPKLCTNEVNPKINDTDTYTKGFQDAIPMFSSNYATDYFGAESIGKKMYKDVMGKEEDSNNSISAFAEKGTFNNFTNSAIVIRNSADKLKKLSRNNPDREAKINSRSLIEEKEFWKYLKLEGKPVYNKEAPKGYKKLTGININSAGHFSYNDGTSTTVVGKPFLDVRGERVHALKLNLRTPFLVRGDK